MLNKKIEAKVEDDRGQLIQVISQSIWKQLNIITRKKGCLGGGHYHKRTHEFFYVQSGELIVKVYPLKNGNPSSYSFKKGDCFEVIPGEQHYMQFCKDTTLVVLYSESFDQSHPDTFIQDNLPKLRDLFNE